MSAALHFVIPGPPVATGRPRAFVSKSGHASTYMPDASRKYQETCRVHAMAAAMKARWKPVSAPCAIELKVYRRERRGDIENIQKGVQDAMNRVVYVDDRQVVEAHVWLHLDRERPRVEVTVRVLEGASW